MEWKEIATPAKSPFEIERPLESALSLKALDLPFRC